MAIADSRDPTITPEPAVVTPEPAASGAPEPSPIAARRSTTMRPEGAELGRRVAVLLFGLIQIVIALRVVLLLLDARAGNVLVSAILNISQVFVAPFDGVLHTNALQSGGSILDVAAVVALVGWTVLELIVLWTIGVFRREPA
jgi:hypothetical protein